MGRPFTQVDVFTDQLTLGNPVAVVHDAEGLDDETLAAFARWTNLSETTFLLPPADERADYRLRIFTPGGELPFAGHPTLGSARAWLHAGGTPRNPGVIVQECGVGLVQVRRHADRLAFAAPPLRQSGPADEPLATQVSAALGLDPARVRGIEWVDNGPGWLGVLVDSAETVLGIEPDHTAMPVRAVGVAGVYPEPGADEPLLEVRAFVGGLGVPEDPVTGSLNAGLAQWLIGAGIVPGSYTAQQGTRLGRRGRIHISQEEDGLWVGGDTVIGVTGTVALA